LSFSCPFKNGLSIARIIQENVIILNLLSIHGGFNEQDLFRLLS
jgi:hypothetical protein